MFFYSITYKTPGIDQTRTYAARANKRVRFHQARTEAEARAYAAEIIAAGAQDVDIRNPAGRRI